MKSKTPHKSLFIGLFILFFGMNLANAQFLLQAPNTGDESNYQWFEASDLGTVLGTNSFYEATQPGVYFATYDGTLCGSNATGYFILTECNAPDNQVTLDISASVPSGATVSWNPALGGDQTRPMVVSTQTVMRYTATITKAGNDTELPRFTVVCMSQAANLADDLIVKMNPLRFPFLTMIRIYRLREPLPLQTHPMVRFLLMTVALPTIPQMIL